MPSLVSCQFRLLLTYEYGRYYYYNLEAKRKIQQGCGTSGEAPWMALHLDNSVSNSG